MQESLSTYLKRPTPARSRPRYLNRRFESVANEAQASVVETAYENRLDLRLAEHDTGAAVAIHHFTRATSNEERFRPARSDEDVLQIGGIVFSPADPGRLEGKLPNGTAIIVGTQLFKKDAEAVLSVLAAHEEALRQTGMASITIGIEDEPQSKGKRLGFCNPKTGRVFFFCDEHGGLLAKGLSTVTQSDTCPFDFERAILHELAHMLEHNETCRAHVEEIAREITGFIQDTPHNIPASWLSAAKAINPEYLPARFSAVFKDGPGREREAHSMAHEFLAELVPAIAWQKKDIQLAPDCPASLKGLYTYICRYGHAFAVADKIEGLTTKTVAQDKNRILVHSDFIEYHGAGPDLGR